MNTIPMNATSDAARESADTVGETPSGPDAEALDRAASHGIDRDAFERVPDEHERPLAGTMEPGPRERAL